MLIGILCAIAEYTIESILQISSESICINAGHIPFAAMFFCIMKSITLIVVSLLPLTGVRMQEQSLIVLTMPCPGVVMYPAEVV